MRNEMTSGSVRLIQAKAPQVRASAVTRRPTAAPRLPALMADDSLAGLGKRIAQNRL
ncbi:hypothetical protein ACFOY2_13205 [Nonomuraea purpurea]|uniref:FXSXX-COOH protein n=1 Tax=Nonomuraea purpurea TaxID=1849276 RepID=A0ABV8G4Y3_9ACTN